MLIAQRFTSGVSLSSGEFWRDGGVSTHRRISLARSSSTARFKTSQAQISLFYISFCVVPIGVYCVWCASHINVVGASNPKDNPEKKHLRYCESPTIRAHRVCFGSQRVYIGWMRGDIDGEPFSIRIQLVMRAHINRCPFHVQRDMRSCTLSYIMRICKSVAN